MASIDYEQVRTRVSAVFSDVLHVEVPSTDTDLFDGGILDSQRFVELIFQLEQNFQTHIDIQDFEIENFRCIEKIAALILEYNSGRHATEMSALASSSSR
jgi:acyl carrier protein